MNKQELLTEIAEFVNSDQVEETDDDIDLGKVAAQLEEFVGDLDDDDEAGDQDKTSKD
jgi:hypothetical protein